MIVIPALAGIAAILEPIIAGAVIGVAASTVVCAGGGAVSGIQSQGTAGEVATSAIHATRTCAEDGTLVEAGLIGGAFGGVAHVAAPALNAVGSAAKPVVAVADDVFGPALRGVGSALDDVARGIGSAVDDIGARLGIGRNGARNAQHFKTMKGAPAGTKYVYVMEDSANGLHKIGMTTKAPPERLSKIASEAKSKLDYTCIIQTDKSSKLEGNLHSMFSNQRTTHPTPHSGATEWFVLTAAQVAAACSH